MKTAVNHDNPENGVTDKKGQFKTEYDPNHCISVKNQTKVHKPHKITFMQPSSNQFNPF